MSLSLDLSQSIAKVTRAGDHLISCEAEIISVLDREKPYSIRFGEVDKESGWCEMFITSYEIIVPSLSLIVGDFIHNLRCALDYIIAALAKASGINSSKNHQFPIVVKITDYTKQFGPNGTTSEEGSKLEGIKYGLREIWGVQPFHTQPEPRKSPLFKINHFSNADKHRLLTGAFGIAGKGNVTVLGGDVIEEDPLKSPLEWKPNCEQGMGRVRFGKPFPDRSQLDYKRDLPVTVFFSAPILRDPKFKAVVAEMAEFREFVKEVKRIIAIFEDL